MKVAIVHDYFNQNGGAEKVCETLLELYPLADIFTSTFNPINFENEKNLNKSYIEGRIKTSILDKLFIKNGKPTFWTKFTKHLYFVYPLVMWLMQVKDYDLVVISSTYCGKNIRLNNNKKIIHYCHSPVRFLHGLITEKDHSTLPIWQKLISTLIKPLLKMLDLGAVKNLIANDTIWISNSKFIKQAVNDVYHVDSDVIYPPVDISRFQSIERVENPKEEFYICHGRISFHKRIDLAIEACIKLNKKLKISGTSALTIDLENLIKLVPEDKKHLIEFLGRTDDQTLDTLVSEAKAMIFPGKEDAGIAPIEMLACGMPIIAYQSGGALEYVIEEINGVFFKEQSVEDVIEAINKFESLSFQKEEIKKSVLKFSDKIFLKSFSEI
jgi:glycosyltransferase involved in cell wall biosynthesis